MKLRALGLASLGLLGGCAVASRGAAPSQSASPYTTSASPYSTQSTSQSQYPAGASSGSSAQWRDVPVSPSVQTYRPSQPADEPRTSPSGTGGAPPATVAPTTPSPQPTQAPTSPGFAQPPPRNVDGTVEQWSAALEAHEASLRAALMASARECRDICMAAGNICVAAREICRLTGDAALPNARDLRCQRARDACSDAGRRRDQSCAVCPPGRG